MQDTGGNNHTYKTLNIKFNVNTKNKTKKKNSPNNTKFVPIKDPQRKLNKLIKIA